MPQTQTTTTFEEFLHTHGRLVYKTKGVSMLPMLHQNRDIVIIEEPEERLKPLDVALYHRGSAYVLHRVIRVCDGYYEIRGDNTYVMEHVPDEAVIGVLTGFVREGRQTSVNDKSYLRYARFWNRIYPLRHMYIRCRHLAGRILRPVLRALHLRKE